MDGNGKTKVLRVNLSDPMEVMRALQAQTGAAGKTFAEIRDAATRDGKCLPTNAQLLELLDALTSQAQVISIALMSIIRAMSGPRPGGIVVPGMRPPANLKG